MYKPFLGARYFLHLFGDIDTFDPKQNPSSPEPSRETLGLVEELGDVANAGALLHEEEDASQPVPHARRHGQTRELALHDGDTATTVRPEK